jgi:histone acetyltransferase (RNA polymerase elongator complex component)
LPDRSKKRKLVVPVFIPNQGCPYQCVFCQQEKITSQSGTEVNAAHVRDVLETALKYPDFDGLENREIAFYGGTFTRIGDKRMVELLNAAAPYIENGLFHSIRISTRPDEIDEKRLDLLKSFHVSTIELGIQSMNNEVLKRSGRGHTAEDTINAMGMLHEYGFNTGAQLMPGLPGDSAEIFLKTVHRVLELKPDIARLYPAVVIKDTVLEKMYKKGMYEPLDLDEAVGICAVACELLEGAGTKVIRIGLMSSPTLLTEGQIVAGPWHCSFGFLVRSHMYLERIKNSFPKPGEAEKINIRTAPGEIPLLRGFRNRNVRLIEERCGFKIGHVIPDESLSSGRIAVEKIERIERIERIEP